MKFKFEKATKEKAKLRLAIFGPSGSGKTFTALRLAAGMGGSVALIDTERGSASKYADRFDFDVLELGQHNIEVYVGAIHAAQQAGYDSLIIDSLSHAWFELLDEVERLARSKYRGNTWSAWSEGTPKQRSLVDAILGFDGHVIATMRTKTEWSVQDAGNGKVRPVRVGTEPQQGKGIEYEFDWLMELSLDHVAVITKDRTGKFQDRTVKEPGEDLGRELAEWLNDGAMPKKRERKPKPEKSAQSKEKKAEAPRQVNGHSWPAQIVTPVVSEGYAEHAKHAVNMLNRSAKLTPEMDAETAVAWAATYRAARDGGSDEDSAVATADATLE